MRILLFVMIVVIHSTSVGLVVPNGLKMGSANWFYADMLRSFAGGAVVVFVLITGYFKSTVNSAPLKDFWKLLLPLGFYSVIIAGYDITQHHASGWKQITDLLTCRGMYYHLWFMWPYLGLVFLGRYLNVWLDTLNRNQMIGLLSVLYVTQSVIPTINIAAGTGVVFPGIFESKLLLFMLFYLQGAYIRRHGIALSARNSLLVYVVSALIIGWLNYLYNIDATGAPKAAKTYYPFFCEYTSVLMIGNAVSLFNFFVKWRFFSPIVNKIAAYTYGAYLVHVIFIAFLQRLLPERVIPYANYQSGWFPLLDLQYLLLIAAVSLSVEALRQLLWRTGASFWRRSAGGTNTI